MILISPRPSLSPVSPSLSKARSSTGNGETKYLMIGAQMSEGIFYNTALMFFPPGRNCMLMGLKSVSHLFGALQSQDAVCKSVCKSWNFRRYKPELLRRHRSLSIEMYQRCMINTLNKALYSCRMLCLDLSHPPPHWHQ